MAQRPQAFSETVAQIQCLNPSLVEIQPQAVRPPHYSPPQRGVKCIPRVKEVLGKIPRSLPTDGEIQGSWETQEKDPIMKLWGR